MRKRKLNIGVFIATYNGEKYIKEQIESIQEQTIHDISIVINDDMSTDETFSILKSMAEKDTRISLSRVKCGGACENFLYLLKNSRKFDCVFLCDQDDVWLPNKIEVFLNTYLKKNSTTPLLIYCDREYVDEKLANINIKEKKYSDSLKRILFQNHIYGCTMMLNKALVNKMLCLNLRHIYMHDHLVALTAVSFGEIIHINEKLVKYRQHANNVTGGINQFSCKKKILCWNEVNRNQMKTFQMCREFCDLYKDESDITKMYLRMLDSNRYMRVVRAIKYGFRRDGFLPTLRAYWVMMQYNSIVDYFNNRT